MPEPRLPLPDVPASEIPTTGVQVRSLKELLDLISGRNVVDTQPQGDAGLAERLPFPFLALVGQHEMRLALLLALINPAIGGVLLVGPRGTGKTTAVRSLLDLLPPSEISTCFYGCLPEDIESGGMEAVCPECARKYGEGRSLTIQDRVRLVELPLNARLEDVIGGLDERAVAHERMRLKRGILAHADRNLLYIDEVNLVGNDIIDAILDAAAQGSYTVRRGPVAATYRARFILVGSMNPEEGSLRAQILDRFGLRIVVRGLDQPSERLEAYRRVRAFHTNPFSTIAQFAEATEMARHEITAARKLLPAVQISEEVAAAGIAMVQKLGIDSLRAEYAMFEAARALAAADTRDHVSAADLRQVAPMALRMRRSRFMQDYFDARKVEETELNGLLSLSNPENPS
jgi:magnesium chelatase subunit I